MTTFWKHSSNRISNQVKEPSGLCSELLTVLGTRHEPAILIYDTRHCPKYTIHDTTYARRCCQEKIAFKIQNKTQDIASKTRQKPLATSHTTQDINLCLIMSHTDKIHIKRRVTE